MTSTNQLLNIRERYPSSEWNEKDNQESAVSDKGSKTNNAFEDYLDSQAGEDYFRSISLENHDENDNDDNWSVKSDDSISKELKANVTPEALTTVNERTQEDQTANGRIQQTPKISLNGREIGMDDANDQKEEKKISALLRPLRETTETSNTVAFSSSTPSPTPSSASMRRKITALKSVGAEQFRHNLKLKSRSLLKIQQSTEEPEPPQIKDIFLKSDLHGLSEWYSADSLRSKTMWSCIVVFTIAALCIELIIVTKEFRDRPILTTYAVKTDPAGIIFPIIYICPMAQIHEDEEYIQNINETWIKENKVREFFSVASFQPDKKGTILQTKDTIWESIAAEKGRDCLGDYINCAPCDLKKDLLRNRNKHFIPKDFQEYFMKAGYPKKTFFQECNFRNQIVDCEEMVDEVFDPGYGKCFAVYAGGKTLKSTPRQTRSGSGVSLVLNLDTKHAYSKKPALYDGIVLKVMGHFDPAHSKKYLLHPGTYTVVNLQRTQYELIDWKRLDGNSQACTDPEEGIEKELEGQCQ